MAAPANGGPALTWPLFIGMVGVLSIIFGGTWVLFQSSRTADREFVNAMVMALNNDIRRSRDDLILVRDGLSAADNYLRGEVASIRKELVERYQLFPTQKEFVLHEKSSDDRWNTQAAVNRQAIDAYLSSKAWEAWRMERDKLISDIRERVIELEKRKKEKD